MSSTLSASQADSRNVTLMSGRESDSDGSVTAHHQLSILLIEDNPGDADLCESYLHEAFGPRIEVVQLGRLSQAEAMLEQRPFDIVLLDLGLPDSSGIDSLISLRFSVPSVPIIVLTGNRDSRIGICAIREHAQDFCAKQDLSPGMLYQSIRHAMERHRLQEQYLRVLETNPDGMIVLDRQDCLLFANQAACHLLDISLPQDIGHRLSLDIMRADGTELALPAERYVEIRTAHLDWNRSPATLIACHDITARKEAEQKLVQMVQVDQLTGLSSRSYFFDYLQRLLPHADREGGTIAILFIDLDRFKHVNDTLGHVVGDELLRLAGERLRANCRRSDFVARMGGDEFAIALPDVKGPDDGAHMAEKLIKAFRQPIDIGASSVSIGLSIGIATYPHCGTDAQGLYAAADTAMYQAKTQGQNHYQFFSEKLQHEVEVRLHREQMVRRAVAEDRLWLAFQPQVCARTGKTMSFEALLRWPKGWGTPLSPSEFVPVLEDTGLIEQVGFQVLMQAAVFAKELERVTGAAYRMAVNVSMRQLYGSGLYEQVAQVLAATNLAPDRLELELTESATMVDLETTVKTLTSLRQLGITIAIDDFGTGYSSLNYLRRLPVDALKIDRSFVTEIGNNRETEAILHSLLSLARALRLKVIAEGVENARQEKFLRKAGCDLLQGYRICRPAPTGTILDWLEQQKDSSEEHS
ncbi:EAL domain-containing protein [Natronospirillum operosum]|uniref:EAL domain-containing protein n=1 Tax=Natronospirillum operosum TaxID=2759953 RepID=A0A4Z0WIH7_9GAMM|nr:EAL domain-containing protein [Natronospirillum operosum]